MDAFQYAIAIKQIDELSTLKAKDAAIREWEAELKDGSRWYYSYKSENFASTALLFKCITKVLKTYDKTRLPDKINGTIRTAHFGLIEDISTKSMPYATLVDTFQFVSLIKCQWPDEQSTRNLIELIADNPLPCIMEFSMQVNSKYSSLTGDEYSMGRVLQLEELKRVLGGTTVYTALECLLTEAYAELNTDYKAITLIEEMQHLVTVATTAAARING